MSVYYSVSWKPDRFYNFALQSSSNDFSLDCLTPMLALAEKIYLSIKDDAVRINQHTLSDNGVIKGPKILEYNKVISLKDFMSMPVEEKCEFMRVAYRDKTLQDQLTRVWESEGREFWMAFNKFKDRENLP